MRCWCGHGRDSHGERNDHLTHCVACERGRTRYFQTAHRFQPIETLRPMPALLLRYDEAA